MKPGLIVSCRDCGALSMPAHSSGGTSFKDGGALVVSWTNGPFPRHEACPLPPERCLWCKDRALGYPSVMGRPLAGETWTVRGPLLAYDVPCLSGTKITAADLVDPYAPRSAGEGPLNGRGALEPTPDGLDLSQAPGITDGNKAPLERPASLAEAFERETGLRPPTRETATDKALWLRWLAWLGQHNVETKPRRTPRDAQLGLF